MAQGNPVSNPDERLDRTELWHLVGIPLIIFVLICLGIGAWMQHTFAPGTGLHPFNNLVMKLVSPDGRYAIERRDLGDDNDAFSEWRLYSPADKSQGEFTWSDPMLEEAHWQGKDKLDILTRGPITPGSDHPTAWHGVKIQYSLNDDPLKS